jgi:hypothetical protein
MLPKEVFLSHSNMDREKASELAETLRRHSIPVWYSKTNINGAQEWHEEIGKALKRCDWFIVILSKESIKSVWVKREMLYALNHKQYENHILPLVIDKCDIEELSWTLSMFQILDMKVSDASFYQQLFKIWGLGYIP